LYLTSHAARVTLIHRRDSLRAEKILQDRLFKNKKVTVLWDTVVHEMLGTMPVPGVTHLALENIKDKSRRNLAVDGVFVAIGHQPATALFKGVLDMDENGYLLHQPGSSKTAVPGVFVAGDVCDPVYRQAVTAAGMGCMAALDAGRFLAEKD
jgi:thioredoxin reductase (NADPH)